MPCSRDWSWSNKASWEPPWVLEPEWQPCPHLELCQVLESSKHQDLDPEVLLGQHLPPEGTVSARCRSSALSCPRTSSSPPQPPDLLHSTRARQGHHSPNRQASTRASQEDPYILELQVSCLGPQQSGAGPCLSMGPPWMWLLPTSRPDRGSQAPPGPHLKDRYDQLG